MKKFVSASYLVFISLLFFSCRKNDSHFIFAEAEIPARLESAIYPVITKPGEMIIGNEQATCTVGETVTIFLPYQVVADDIQNATLYINDAETGEVLREMAMVPSTDLSIINIIVPEEIQGTSYMFASIPIENNFSGKRLGLSTKITAYKLSSEDAMTNAIRVQ